MRRSGEDYSETRVTVPRNRNPQVDATIRQRRPRTELIKAHQLWFRSNTTVVDRAMAAVSRAFDSGSAWLGIDVVFATGTNAADVQDRAIRATAIR